MAVGANDQRRLQEPVAIGRYRAFVYGEGGTWGAHAALAIVFTARGIRHGTAEVMSRAKKVWGA